jgi:ribonuclease Z
LPCPNNIQYIKGIDLLYHEATFADSEKGRASATFHSTASQAATIARDAEVKRLVIGHFSSRYNECGQLLYEAREIFTESYNAEEGKTFHL